jgi:hypothetical protein
MLVAEAAPTASSALLLTETETNQKRKRKNGGRLLPKRSDGLELGHELDTSLA